MDFSRMTSTLGFVAILVAALAGCRGRVSHEWEIAVENRSDAAADFVVTYGIQSPNVKSQGSASVANVAKGKPLSLIVGSGVTVIKTVKVTRNGESQELTPDAEIGPGKKYFVVVESDGKASGSVSNR